MLVESHLPEGAAEVQRVIASYLGAKAGALALADGLVNTTPMGMAKLPGTPVPVELLRAELWVAEIVYFPLETALVQAAQQRGCRVANGGGMAVFQAVGAFSLFTGLQPDARRMLAHFQELTGSTVNNLARRA